MATLSIEVFNASKPDAYITVINDAQPDETILGIKKRLSQKIKLSTDRLALRLDAKGKNLKDEQFLSDLNLPSKGAQLFMRDLGPQIGWKTVFIMEYLGPFLIYPVFYARPAFIYGRHARIIPIEFAVHCALICWMLHYAKRLYETEFVHRFSNGTMPLFNIFKNCGYYWGFAAFLGYFINHPFYTAPAFGHLQIFCGLAAFLICELGNLSIHLLLRSLRPPGSKVRKIPMPNANPLSQLFYFVSCPNYTYEVGSWLAFSVMSQSLPALIFTAAGFLQMSIWAKGKHRNYLREFPNYPKNRRAIIPFVL